MKRFGALPWLLLLGLVLRAVLVGYDGMADVDVYRRWGTGTYQRGLVAAFQGIYFPAQYQLFGLVAALTSLGGRFVVWMKVLNLVLEVAVLVMLLVRAGDPRRRWLVCWMYWLNPWFIALAALGYCDFQFGFFIALFLFLFREDGDVRRSLLAGVPLGVAFLMKPQAMVALMMMAFVGVFLLAKRRPRLLPLILVVVPSVVLFAGYSVWFAVHGKPLGTLVAVYLRTSAVMPSLTANMLNVWHPLPTLLHAAEAVWKMRDDTLLFRGLSFRILGLGLTMLLQLWYAGTAVLRRPQGYELLSALAFATLLVPLAMTGAHENHPYLGMLCLVMLAASGRLPRLGLGLFVALSVLWTVNLVGHYGLGHNPLSASAPVAAWKSLWAVQGVRLVAEVLVLAAFLALLAYFFSDAAGDERLGGSRWSRAPVLVAAAFLVVVYATTAVEAERLRKAPLIVGATRSAPRFTALLGSTVTPAYGVVTMTVNCEMRSCPTAYCTCSMPNGGYLKRSQSPDGGSPGTVANPPVFSGSPSMALTSERRDALPSPFARLQGCPCTSESPSSMKKIVLMIRSGPARSVRPAG